MRKPSIETRRWHQIHARNVHRRQPNSRRKRKKRLASQQVLANVSKREWVIAPRELSLFANTADETIRFVERVRKMAARGLRVLIDFSKTNQLTATGSVYLYSEIDRLQRDHGVAVVRFNLKGISSHIGFVLREVGLIELAHTGPRSTGQLLPIVAGQDDDRIQEIVDYVIGKAVRDEHLGGTDASQAEKLTGGAISEAMLNVKYHAYPHLETKRWWLTAAILDSQLYIVLCDRGVGIPVTLPRQDWFEILRGKFPFNDDAEMIQAAMRYTRTSQTRKHRRGLGSRDIQQLVVDRRSGHLTVVSGSGHYRLSGEQDQEEITKLNADVGGTVIQWTIPIQPG